MLLEEATRISEVNVLGIFGSINKVSENTLQDILTLILQELGHLPDKVLIPSEGNSSIYIGNWAESIHIKTQIFRSDWIQNGRIAQIIRDDRMYKECTHALVFLSQKSCRLEKYAEKMCKNGKTVFTSSHSLIQLEKLYYEPLASKPVHKSSKRTGQTLLKFQK